MVRVRDGRQQQSVSPTWTSRWTSFCWWRISSAKRTELGPWRDQCSAHDSSHCLHGASDACETSAWVDGRVRVGSRLHCVSPTWTSRWLAENLSRGAEGTRAAARSMLVTHSYFPIKAHKHDLLLLAGRHLIRTAKCSLTRFFRLFAARI